MLPQGLTVYTTSIGAVRQERNACIALRQLFSTLGILHTEVDLADQKLVTRNWITTRSQKPHMPQVFVGEQFIADYELIDQWNEDGILQTNLAHALEIHAESPGARSLGKRPAKTTWNGELEECTPMPTPSPQPYHANKASGSDKWNPALEGIRRSSVDAMQLAQLDFEAWRREASSMGSEAKRLEVEEEAKRVEVEEEAKRVEVEEEAKRVEVEEEAKRVEVEEEAKRVEVEAEEEGRRLGAMKAKRREAEEMEAEQRKAGRYAVEAQEEAKRRETDAHEEMQRRAVHGEEEIQRCEAEAQTKRRQVEEEAKRKADVAAVAAAQTGAEINNLWIASSREEPLPPIFEHPIGPMIGPPFQAVVEMKGLLLDEQHKEALQTLDRLQHVEKDLKTSTLATMEQLAARAQQEPQPLLPRRPVQSRGPRTGQRRQNIAYTPSPLPPIRTSYSRRASQDLQGPSKLPLSHDHSLLTPTDLTIDMAVKDPVLMERAAENMLLDGWISQIQADALAILEDLKVGAKDLGLRSPKIPVPPQQRRPCSTRSKVQSTRRRRDS